MALHSTQFIRDGLEGIISTVARLEHELKSCRMSFSEIVRAGRHSQFFVGYGLNQRVREAANCQGVHDGVGNGFRQPPLTQHMPPERVLKIH